MFSLKCSAIKIANTTSADKREINPLFSNVVVLSEIQVLELKKKILCIKAIIYLCQHLSLE